MLGFLAPTGDASEDALVDDSVGGSGCVFELVLPVTLGWIVSVYDGRSISATPLTSVAASGAVSWELVFPMSTVRTVNKTLQQEANSGHQQTLGTQAISPRGAPCTTLWTSALQAHSVHRA